MELRPWREQINQTGDSDQGDFDTCDRYVPWVRWSSAQKWSSDRHIWNAFITYDGNYWSSDRPIWDVFITYDGNYI